MFALLDKGEMPLADMAAYLASVPIYRQMRETFFGGSNDEVAARMLGELVAAKAVTAEGGVLRPMMRA